MERKNDNDYPLLMSREQAAEFCGMGKDTFDEVLRFQPDFPKCKKKSDDVFPREPMIEWIKMNWRSLA